MLRSVIAVIIALVTAVAVAVAPEPVLAVSGSSYSGVAQSAGHWQAALAREMQNATSRLAPNLAAPHPGIPEVLTHPESDSASADGPGLTSTRTPAAVSGTATVAAPAELGLDVSSHQGSISWGQVAAEGAKFAYVKSTEGTYYYDARYFPGQYNGSYSAGLVRGAYHFAIPNNSTGAAQADYFVAHGGGWTADGRTLPGMLDVEYNPYGSTCYGLTHGQMVGWILSFVAEYLRLTGRRPVVYTTTNWWTTCTGNATGFADSLAIANYGYSPYPLPASWASYAIWQYADHGLFPGDQDRFNGTYPQLIEFASGFPVQASYTGSDRLSTGQWLQPGQGILSANGLYAVVMQSDGNLVEYTFGPRALWASGTWGHPGARVIMQGDGNLVIYQGSVPLWSTGTWGQGPSFAAIQNDNNFVVYTDAGRATWASRYGRLY
jgi:GH25 family lysozyme M1 (1,4-beta-N-acetylmuramidase)